MDSSIPFYTSFQHRTDTKLYFKDEADILKFNNLDAFYSHITELFFYLVSMKFYLRHVLRRMFYNFNPAGCVNK